MKQKKIIDDRRRSQRTIVQESFNLYLVIPDLHGMARIYMRDISSTGLRFLSEMETNFKAGQKFKARLYLSPAIYLPMDCSVVRVLGGGEVAVDFVDPESGSAKAIAKLQEFFEAVEDHGVLVE